MSRSCHRRGQTSNPQSNKPSWNGRKIAAPFRTMARRRRSSPGGFVYHVCNRGSRKGVLFDTCEAYSAFLRLMDEARSQRPMRIIAYNLMRTHFHFLLWPKGDRDLPRFMHWLTTTHAIRWHRDHGSVGTGAVYQSRYQAIPIRDERHLFTAWLYVERNALTAHLVARAEDWPWSSAARPECASSTFVADSCPYPRLPNWVDLLNDLGA